MLFRATLFSLITAIVFAEDSTVRPPTETEIKTFQNTVQILRYTLKVAEAAYEKDMNETVPVSEYVDSTMFAHRLLNVVYTQAARTNGVLVPGDKLENGMEYIQIAKALSGETD